MLRLENVSSLVMRMNSLATDFGMIRIKKIIRSRNVVFHKTTLYKEKSGDSIDATNTASKNPKFVSLDILEFTPQDQTIDMRIPVVIEDGTGPSTSQSVLRRSTRFVGALNRYSSSLDYILLLDSGELESYKEALQDENSNK